MWAEKEKYRNHFLQLEIKHLEPKHINELVNNELIKSKSKRSHCITFKKTWKNCNSAFYFENRAQLAYGFWALPKLMKELGSDDCVTQWRAINSLSEYIVNPLHCQRALKYYDIVRRCNNLFLRIFLKYQKARNREKQGLFVIFYHLARHKIGAQLMVQKHRLLDQFYTMLVDRKEFSKAICRIMPLLSTDLDNVVHLIDNYKVIKKLKRIYEYDVCTSHYSSKLWLHLSHVLEQAPKEAVAAGFFDILQTRIRGRLPQFHVWDMKCFALLLRCCEGQTRFVEVDGVKMLYDILKEEDLNSYEQVVYALMNGLFAKKVLWRCREFTDMPLIIVKLAGNPEERNQQLYCLQTLREMGVMPAIKRFMKENCLEDIKNLECRYMANINAHERLIYWLEREIYHTTDLQKEDIILEEQ